MFQGSKFAYRKALKIQVFDVNEGNIKFNRGTISFFAKKCAKLSLNVAEELQSSNLSSLETFSDQIKSCAFFCTADSTECMLATRTMYVGLVNHQYLQIPLRQSSLLCWKYCCRIATALQLVLLESRFQADQTPLSKIRK